MSEEVDPLAWKNGLLESLCVLFTLLPFSTYKRLPLANGTLKALKTSYFFFFLFFFLATFLISVYASNGNTLALVEQNRGVGFVSIFLLTQEM